MSTQGIPQETYDRIAATLHSDSSPVGIDAKKTHVLIVHMLEDLGRRLARVEAKLGLTNTE